MGAEGGPSLSKEGEEGEPERGEEEAEAEEVGVAGKTKRDAINVAAVFSSNDNVLVVDGEDGTNVGSPVGSSEEEISRNGFFVGFFFRRTRMFELGLRSCKGNMISKFMPPSIVFARVFCLGVVTSIWDVGQS